MLVFYLVNLLIMGNIFMLELQTLAIRLFMSIIRIAFNVDWDTISQLLQHVHNAIRCQL